MRLVLAAFFCLNTFGATFLDTAPIRFEPNPRLAAMGGATSPVQWMSRGGGYAFLFTNDATLLKTTAGMVKLTFPGASGAAKFAGDRPVNARINYFIGREYAGVRGYARLRRDAIYPGIDLVYYGRGHEIEYDFEIAPGADASRIRMKFEGANAMRLNERGEIVLECAKGEITQRTPAVYQRRESGEIVAIPSSYVLEKNHTARVKLGKYDAKRALIIDPTITYAAYLQGELPDSVVSVAHDPQGRIYVAGSTFSTEFPVTAQAYQSAVGGTDAENLWVAQIDPTAGSNALIYCSYIGGASTDLAAQMTVDANGVMYLTGSTDSTAFPVTSGAYLNTLTSNSHPFVTMIDPSQQGAAGLIYSTYFGGSNYDAGSGIAVANGKIYITGWTNSVDLPLAGNSYQPQLNGGNDAFVAEFDPTQSGTASLVNSTYLGGSLDDEGNSIAIDSSGLVYIGGETDSFDYPTTPNAFQSGIGGYDDVFLAVLDLNAGTLNYSSYLGGSSIENVKRIELTSTPGNVALTGYTLSPNFPVTANAYQGAMPGPGNAFISVLNTSPSVTPGAAGLLYSTYFGGSGGEVAYDLRLDAAGRFYIGGYTMSPNLPVTGNAMFSSSIGGTIDGFIAVIDPSQPPYSALVYSSYLTGLGTQIVYGMDLDTYGDIYVTGVTTANVFPNSVPPNPDTLKTSVFLLTFTLP